MTRASLWRHVTMVAITSWRASLVRFTMVTLRNGRDGSATLGPSDLGPGAMKGYPLLFHTTHSDHVQLTPDKRRANRVESFCKGICFSNRPVAVNERVYIKFSDVSTSWSGVVRFGFTACNPATINSAELPRYACPDLTNKPGYWAKALPERFAEKDTVLFFYVTRGGDVMYGVNSEENGLFFSGVGTAGPIWALIDIYGNTISVEFVDGYQLNNVSSAPASNAGGLGCSPGGVITTATTIQHDNWQNASIPTQVGSPSTTLQSMLSGGAPTEIAPPPPRATSSHNAHYTPLPFHSTIGRNVCLSPDKTIAVRLKHEYCNGYVFTDRPMRCGDTLVVQILSIMPVGDGLNIGGLAFGMTACDPAGLRSELLPDDSDMLLDRPEYWIVNKDVCAKPRVGDELSFLFTHQGEVRYGRNGRLVTTLMFVDKTLPMWMFFDVFGNTQKIKSHGILTTAVQSPSTASQSSRLTVSLPPPRTQPDIIASTTAPPRPPPPHQRALPSVPMSSLATLSVPLSSLATPPSLPPKQYKSAPQLQHLPMPHSTTQASTQLRHCHSGASITASLPPPLIPTPVSTNPFLSNVEQLSNIQLAESLATKRVLMPAASGGSVKVMPDNLKVMRDAWNDDDESAADNATTECSVCFENAVDCVLYTCGHMCLCYDCAVDIKNNQNALCPICRQEIKDIIKTYRS